MFLVTLPLSVPIYDARYKPFDPEFDLNQLHSKFPPFHGEIPVGSFSFVGYSASSYLKAGNPHLSCNILWVVLIGTPGMAAAV